MSARLLRIVFAQTRRRVSPKLASMGRCLELWGRRMLQVAPRASKTADTETLQKQKAQCENDWGSSMDPQGTERVDNSRKAGQILGLICPSTSL